MPVFSPSGGIYTALQTGVIDAFEGPAYRRKQVDVQLLGGGTVAAVCYVAADLL